MPRLAVGNLLMQEEVSVTETSADSAKDDGMKRRDYERRVDLVNAAVSIFDFFLPTESEGPTVLKYWGALYRMMAVSLPSLTKTLLPFMLMEHTRNHLPISTTTP